MPTLLHYSDVENAFDRPERVARLAAALQTPADAVVVGSGDVLAPGALANEHEGRQALPFFEAVGPAAETFGNHDFDFGTNALQTIIKESPQPWVSANVTLPDVDIPQSVAIERNDGRISTTGVTTPDAIGDWLDGVGSTDPVDAARQVTDHLKRDCDYVVLLAHVGDETATTLARETAADVVCAGHVHSERVDHVDGTCIVRPDANGQLVSVVDLDTLEVASRHVPDWAPDTPVGDRVRNLREGTGLDDVVTHVETPVPRDRQTRYDGTSTVARFVAAATRWAVDADIGVIDSGGVRDGPPLAGDITVGEVRGLYPFEAPIAVIELDGSQLRALVDSAIRPDEYPDNPVWAYLDGLTVDWTTDGVEEVTRRDGPLAADGQYTVAASAYVAGSGTFDGVTDVLTDDDNPLHPDALVAYAREEGFT
ncbi:bifunctional metallophosphatase/5'-nucleotidase [Halococcus agarilyticus]|uniref:bifunctional metallophosphatase/5'-nucleotidase n=1 Tax=Halococcus agarilyticus TaxID=1232219 RepID=UPI0018964790|nr:bifunctional metallophosphatase/5'-nucleotidase [Halococcus agarilyticus]